MTKLILGHVGRGTGTFRPFHKVFTDSRLVDASDVEKVDALVIWGGEDISPSLYNEKATPNCYAGNVLSARDKLESSTMQAAIERGIPIIGVCRGAQLACAMAGGKLVQDVNNHGTSHKIDTFDGRTMTTSSVHHQMMYPFQMDKKDYQILAWADQPRSKGWYEGVNEEPEVEPEIVFFPNIKALAIQGHPEFMNEDHEFVTYCNELVSKFLLTEQA